MPSHRPVGPWSNQLTEGARLTLKESSMLEADCRSERLIGEAVDAFERLDPWGQMEFDRRRRSLRESRAKGGAL